MTGLAGLRLKKICCSCCGHQWSSTYESWWWWLCRLDETVEGGTYALFRVVNETTLAPLAAGLLECLLLECYAISRTRLWRARVVTGHWWVVTILVVRPWGTRVTKERSTTVHVLYNNFEFPMVYLLMLSMLSWMLLYNIINYKY